MFFTAKTTDGHIFKILSELLQTNMKQTYLEISQDGIKMKVMDNKVLFDLTLEADNFGTYIFNGKAPVNIGINLKHLYKMLKSMKKKDSIELYIVDENMENLGIKVIPRENNRISNSFIRIHTHQTIDMDIPSGYKRPVIVSSSDFQKMIKDLRSISTHVAFKAYEFGISFSCNIDNVYSKDIAFGECKEGETERMDEEFDINQLLGIIKIAGLTKNIQIFSKPDFPILFKTLVGSLGTLSIFVKSENMISET